MSTSAIDAIRGRRPTEESDMTMIRVALQQQGNLLAELYKSMQAFTERLDAVIKRLDNLP